MDSTPKTASEASAEVGDSAESLDTAHEAEHLVASVDGYGDLDHNDRDAVPAEPPTPPAMPAVAAAGAAAATDDPAEGEDA